MTLIIINAISTCLVGSLCVIGWFVKKDMAEFVKRLDKHDDILLTLVRDVSELSGFQQAFKGEKE